jgi:hypothetical protein
MSDMSNTVQIEMWPAGKVAGVLSVSIQTVQRLMDKGELGEVYKMGRITRVKAQGVLDYISRSQRKPNSNGHDGEGA